MRSKNKKKGEIKKMAVISLELLKYVKQIVNVNKVSLILFFFCMRNYIFF